MSVLDFKSVCVRLSEESESKWWWSSCPSLCIQFVNGINYWSDINKLRLIECWLFAIVEMNKEKIQYMLLFFQILGWSGAMTIFDGAVRVYLSSWNTLTWMQLSVSEWTAEHQQWPWLVEGTSLTLICCKTDVDPTSYSMTASGIKKKILSIHL